MVQFVNLPVEQRHQMDAAIGQSLGKGLAEFGNMYFANKALDRIINDPSLKDAPVSEKMGRLEAALRLHGEFGQQVFQKRLGIEQLAMQEKEEKKMQAAQKAKSKIASKLFKGENLTPEEEEVLDPRERALIAKAMQPKAPPGGITAQPVPQEVNQKIGEVLKNTQGMGPDQLSQAFDAAGIPPVFSNKYVENARQMQQKPTYEPTEEKLEAERQSKFADEIMDDYKASQGSKERLNSMIALAKSGQLSTPAMVKGLNFFGLPIGVLQNPASEAYQKLENDFIKDVSRYFPGAIRVYEAQTYMKTIPSMMNSDEGKILVGENLRLQDEAKEVKYHAYKDILKENGGKKPRNMDLLLNDRVAPKLAELGEKFSKNVEDALEKFSAKITMYNENGERFEIPQDKMQKALEKGLKF